MSAKLNAAMGTTKKLITHAMEKKRRLVKERATSPKGAPKAKLYTKAINEKYTTSANHPILN
jgi:hypothetical protein